MKFTNCFCWLAIIVVHETSVRKFDMPQMTVVANNFLTLEHNIENIWDNQETSPTRTLCLRCFGSEGLTGFV